MAHDLEVTQRPQRVTRDEAVAALFERHYTDLVGLARLLVDTRAEAEEVVQEGFARLFASFSRLDDPARAIAYLRSVVLNLARSRLRRRRTARDKEHLLPDRVGEDGERLDGADRERVRAAVRALPRRQQECVALRYYYDNGMQEIADTLGIGVGTVKKNLHRARAALAANLEGLA